MAKIGRNVKLKKVAVTGGLACGKSKVCSFLKLLGAYVVSADEVVHQLLSSDTILGQKVIRLIGSDIVVDGHIHRPLVAKKVFDQPELLHALESLLHPAVFDEIETRFQKARAEDKNKLFVAEIPLLYESGFDPFFDAVIAVVADSDTCGERFTAIGKEGLEEYKKRSQHQMSMVEKAQRADYVIENNGSLDALRQSVENVYKQLIEK